MLVVVLGLILGLLLGLLVPYTMPVQGAKYVAVALLAGLDSVLGGTRAGIRGKFDFLIFSTGFVSNTLLAAGVTLVGEKLGVDLHLVVGVAFAIRVFDNLAIIRRELLGRPGPSGDPAPTAEIAAVAPVAVEVPEAVDEPGVREFAGSQWRTPDPMEVLERD